MAISPGGRPADASPVGTPGGRQNWVDKAGGLPKYVRMVAHALMRKGMSKQQAIPTAVNRLKRWAAGLDNVRPQVQAAAAKAIAEWNAKKGAGMSLAAHLEGGELVLDLAAEDELYAILEADDTLDLAASSFTPRMPRKYIRAGDGKFSRTQGYKRPQSTIAPAGGTPRPAGGGPTMSGDAPAKRFVAADRRQIKSPEVDPAKYRLNGLADVRSIMAHWDNVPPKTKRALKARMVQQARKFGAGPRVTELIGRLGDGDGKAEKGEGGAAAFRQLQKRRRRADSTITTRKRESTMSLSTPGTPHEGHLDVRDLVDLSTEVPAEYRDAVAEEYAGTVIDSETVDLAPGDYSPPYDWKHGYIPLTPAAALSKAKRPPYAGKGGKRAKPRTPGKTSKAATTSRRKKTAAERQRVADQQDKAQRDTADRALKTQKATQAAMEKRAAIRKARDDEQRGRGIPGADTGRNTTLNMPAPTSSPERQRAAVKGGLSNMSDDDLFDALTKVGRIDRDKATDADRARLRLLSNERHRRAETGQGRFGKLKGKTRYMPESARDEGDLIAQKQDDELAKRRAERERRLGPKRIGSPPSSDGPGMETTRTTTAGFPATRSEQASRKNLPGGGSYPTKPDGSPDYGAMSAEQAASIRAKEAGRGVGARVQSDRGPGTVKAVSSRGTTIDPDNPNEGPFHVAAGTPGHDRIKPRRAGKDTDRRPVDPLGRTVTALPNRSDETATDRRAQERAIARKDYDNAEGPALAKAASDRGLIGEQRALQKSDKDLRKILKDADARTAASQERGPSRGVSPGARTTPAPNARAESNPFQRDPAATSRPPKVTDAEKAKAKADADKVTAETLRNLPQPQLEANIRRYEGTGRDTETLRLLKAERDRRRTDPRRTELEGGPSATPPTRGELIAGKRDERDTRRPNDMPGFGQTTSTNPDAPIRVEHGPDGTLVHGTERADAPDLKAAGFKWSRNLNAWYLPRTWGESTREQRVRQLEGKLGDKVGVDRTSGPRKSAAERDAEKRERAAGRAERMDERATRRTKEAEDRFKASDAATEGIPFGQPILVGHHSQRRHERALERARSQGFKGLEATREAERATQAADRARRTAEGKESKTTTGNRIKKLEAEKRSLERKLKGTGKEMHGENKPATGAYAEKLRNRAAEVDDELEFNRGRLAEAGGVPSKESVKPGDYVKVGGQWYPVRKSNAQTVGVPNPMIPNRSRNAPWHEVQEHKSADEVTRADVAKMIQSNSTAFPEVNRMLAESAPPKGADDNGVTVGPASAQVEAPGTWTARRRDDGTVQVLSKNGVELGTVRQVKAGKRKGQWEARAEGRRGADYGKTPEEAIDGLYDSYQGKAGEAARARGLSAGAAPEAPNRGGVLNMPPPTSSEATQRAAVKTTPGGINEDAARRMSDEQLDRAMARLMENGTYSGPAFTILERELDRRDKARRAEGNGRRR